MLYKITIYQWEKCQPLYNDKPFRMNDDENVYNCKKCECNKHADSCHYDVTMDENSDDHFVGGGGVCDDCKHHTTGIVKNKNIMTYLYE